MELSEAVEVLEVIAGRKSGMTTLTQQRDASRVVLDVLAEQGEPEWEYGYDSIADAEAERPTLRRRKAGPWEPVEENGENT